MSLFEEHELTFRTSDMLLLSHFDIDLSKF